MVPPSLPTHQPCARRLSGLALLLVLALGGACTDQPTTPTPAAVGVPAPAPTPAAQSPRERLAARLALALADPSTRAEFAARLAASHAPEGKLQFQALTRTADRQLLTRLATAGDGGMATLLADLDAARGLEVYLPVPAHRKVWQGDPHFLVATLERDGERPVAFDATGHRSLLDADRPPATPVIALVPQEFDFTAGRPALAMACPDVCGGDTGGGGGTAGGSTTTQPRGLFLTGVHFDGDYESWLKGSPEFEFHVYGEVSGDSEQLSCAGGHAKGAYRWSNTNPNWQGSVALLTEDDIAKYTARSATDVVRIVAWEDDDTPCVPVTNANSFGQMVKSLDAFYNKWTGSRIKAALPKGVEAAAVAYGLASSVRNVILTNDDLIGHGVEASIAGWVPGGANFVLKGTDAITTGWFTTSYRR